VSDSDGVGDLEALLREETRGEYSVERELSRGWQGVVYLATEIPGGRRVALNVLLPHLTFGKGAAKRFLQGAQLAAALDHPNIIPIYRICSPAPGARLVWYAMKYVEGESLADVLKRRRRLPLDETLTILRQVAGALDYAHRQRVIHRDVKPANVLLMPTGRVVLTDFTIAKQYEASPTASGSAVGTPYYMSGEQVRGTVLTQAADQYSVGIMAYHMLAGHVPFEADSVVDVLRKHCSEPPPPLDALRPGLPGHVYAAVDRAMAKEPMDRFPSVGAFVEALAGGEAASRGTGTVEEEPRRETTTTRRGIGWWVGGAVLLLGVWLLGREAPESAPRDPLVIDSAAVASFGAFFEPYKPALRGALRRDSIVPSSKGPHAVDYSFDVQVQQATRRVIDAGEATATVFMMGEQTVFGVMVPATVILEFERLERNGPWYLLTDGGYLHSLGIFEGERKSHSLSPDGHVAIRETFPHTMEFWDWASRSVELREVRSRGR